MEQHDCEKEGGGGTSHVQYVEPLEVFTDRFNYSATLRCRGDGPLLTRRPPRGEEVSQPAVPSRPHRGEVTPGHSSCRVCVCDTACLLSVANLMTPRPIRI